jgi:hypothetical protein
MADYSVNVFEQAANIKQALIHILPRSHCTQPKNIQPNDTQHKNTQHINIQHEITQHKTLSILKHSITIKPSSQYAMFLC